MSWVRCRGRFLVGTWVGSGRGVKVGGGVVVRVGVYEGLVGVGGMGVQVAVGFDWDAFLVPVGRTGIFAGVTVGLPGATLATYGWGDTGGAVVKKRAKGFNIPPPPVLTDAVPPVFGIKKSELTISHPA